MDLDKTRVLSDLELLDIQVDMLWASRAGPELVIICARDGVRVRIGPQVALEVARTMSAQIEEDAPCVEDVAAPPAQMERLRSVLEDALGAAVRLAPGSGPTYLIEPGVSFRTMAELIRSDTADPAQLRAANPGSWGADEWQELLDGRLGPWVMARHTGRVSSICHTPVADAIAADAGVWTHPDFRGQGHAAATTAEWADLLRPTGKLLFYSTSRTNRSSQRVAARLGLRRIGFRWQLQSMNPGAGWTEPRVRARASTVEGDGLYASAPIR